MTSRIVAVAAVAATAALLGTSVPAAAQTASGTGVSLTPSRVEEDLTGHGAVQRLTFVNSDPVPHELVIEVAGLAHDLLGTPEFPAQAGEAFRLEGATRVVLEPGEAHDVEVVVDFTGAASAYGSVIATLDPQTASMGDLGAVNRVAGLLLFRGPGPWDQRIQLRDAGVELSDDGTHALLLLDLANIGDTHTRPDGTVRILRDGAPVGVVELRGEVVLPGSARRHVVSWIPPAGLDGPVEVVVDLDGQRTTGAVVDLGSLPDEVAAARVAAGLPPGGAEFAGPGGLELPDTGRPWWIVLLALVLLLLTAEALRRAWLGHRRELAVAGSERD